jgi:CheY-like chemotaxis protein
VIDHGIGIDPKNHRRIFHEFQQLDGSITRQFGGTGLGLALVRKFVEMHGGTVELESALGEGSTFSVNLPIRFHGVLPKRRESGPDDTMPGALRVLVVEDEVEAYQNIATHLREGGYAAIHAATGEEGIKLAREMRPSAITLDMILPGIDGIEVLKRLKADPQTRDIPVIIVSVVENRELGIAFGAKDYLVKPVDCDQLLDTLQRFIPPPGDGKLLVIDDDRELHDLLERHLSPHGYSLVHAYAVKDGVTRASADRPSLVILDLMMQEMNGFDVAAQLNADPRTTRLPILAVTNKELSSGDRERLRGKVHALMRRGELSGTRLVNVIRDLIGSTEKAG